MSTGGPLGHMAGGADKTGFGRLAEILRARQLIERAGRRSSTSPPPR